MGWLFSMTQKGGGRPNIGTKISDSQYSHFCPTTFTQFLVSIYIKLSNIAEHMLCGYKPE